MARFWRAQGSCVTAGEPAEERAAAQAETCPRGRSESGPRLGAQGKGQPPVPVLDPGLPLKSTRLRALPVVGGKDRTEIAPAWKSSCLVWMLPLSWRGRTGARLQPWLCRRRLASRPVPDTVCCARARGAACNGGAGFTRPATQDAMLCSWSKDVHCFLAKGMPACVLQA